MPETGPSTGSGEEDSVTDESSVTGAGVEDAREWVAAIRSSKSRPGVDEGEKLLGNDETRAARNVFEIVCAPQSICEPGVATWERGGGVKISGMASSPKSAAGFCFVRDHS